jgi:hypothetical protein
VFQQDAVLQGLVPALDLALGHGMIRSATGVLHVLAFEPFRQVTGDVASARKQKGRSRPDQLHAEIRFVTELDVATTSASGAA